LTSYCLV